MKYDTSRKVDRQTDILYVISSRLSYFAREMQHMLAESTFEMFTGPETITVSVTDRSCSAVRVTFHGKLRLNVT